MSGRLCAKCNPNANGDLCVILWLCQTLRRAIYCFVFLRGRCVFVFPGSMLSCFLLFLLLCFSCFSAFCFSCFLLFLLCFSCFSALPASFLFCFSAFPASLLLCFCASVPFYFYYSTFSFLQSCVFAALLPAPLLLCFLFLLPLCFFNIYFALFSPVCILNETLKTLGETQRSQRNPKEILMIRNPLHETLEWNLKKPSIYPKETINETLKKLWMKPSWHPKETLNDTLKNPEWNPKSNPNWIPEEP